MIAQFRLYPDSIYRCEPFQEFVWQQHGFGTRNANPTAVITVRQIHSTRVLDARTVTDRSDEGDALVSDQIGRCIGVRTADCVPILILDAHCRSVAAIHAGWRGTAGSIVQTVVDKMRALYGSRPEDLYAAIGPCIQACCYEVSSDVAGQFTCSV